jgi:lipopolysaccharide export system permease protein
MKVVDRFLLKGLLTKVGLFLFMLAGIYLLSDAIEKSKGLGEGGYTLADHGYFLLLRLPQILYQMAPFAVLLGTLGFLSELVRQGELVALRSAGLSMARLTRPLLLGGLLVSLMAFALQDQVGGPLAVAAERFYQSEAKGRQMGRWVSGGGVWFREEGRVVSVQRVARSGKTMRGVRLFEYGPRRQITALVEADRATFGDGRWHLHDIRRLEAETLAVHTAERRSLRLSIGPDVLSELGSNHNRMSTWELWRYVSELEKQGHSVGDLEFRLWQKFSLPLSSMVMVLVAVPFTNMSPRAGSGAGRILLGVILGMAFQAANKLAGNLSGAGVVEPWLAAWGPVVGFSVLGLGLLFRMR